MSATPSTQPRKRICVFTSTTTGRSPAHTDAAHDLATALHTHSAELIYGGGTTGLMSLLSKTLVDLSEKYSVHDVMPLSILPIERPESATNTTTSEGKPSEKKR